MSGLTLEDIDPKIRLHCQLKDDTGTVLFLKISFIIQLSELRATPRGVGGPGDTWPRRSGAKGASLKYGSK